MKNIIVTTIAILGILSGTFSTAEEKPKMESLELENSGMWVYNIITGEWPAVPTVLVKQTPKGDSMVCSFTILSLIIVGQDRIIVFDSYNFDIDSKQYGVLIDKKPTNKKYTALIYILNYEEEKQKSESDLDEKKKEDLALVLPIYLRISEDLLRVLRKNFNVEELEKIQIPLPMKSLEKLKPKKENLMPPSGKHALNSKGGAPWNYYPG